MSSLGVPKDPKDVHVVDHAASIHILWLVLDGVGLSIIAACTIFQTFHEWKDTFQYHYDGNAQVMTLWIIGRFFQVLALLLLMSYAATLNQFPQLEVIGMFLLTAGPMLCISASLLFETDETMSKSFGIEWLLEEAAELVGILLLDFSMIETFPELELLAEVSGFFFLGLAALLDFKYISDTSYLPAVFTRFDMIHGSDAFGLVLLTLVGIADYRARKEAINVSLDKFHKLHSSSNLSDTESAGPSELLRRASGNGKLDGKSSGSHPY
jgi:hypothetical protein